MKFKFQPTIYIVRTRPSCKTDINFNISSKVSISKNLAWHSSIIPLLNITPFIHIPQGFPVCISKILQLFWYLNYFLSDHTPIDPSGASSILTLVMALVAKK